MSLPPQAQPHQSHSQNLLPKFEPTPPPPFQKEPDLIKVRNTPHTSPDLPRHNPKKQCQERPKSTTRASTPASILGVTQRPTSPMHLHARPTNLDTPCTSHKSRHAHARLTNLNSPSASQDPYLHAHHETKIINTRSSDTDKPFVSFPYSMFEP